MLSGLASPFRAAELGIRIVAPRNLSTVLGPTTIELGIDLPAGASIDHVEIRVDGQSLTRLRTPPWRTAWDAGDGRRGHEIEARLVLADGRTAHATARTSPLRIEARVEVERVNLYPIVRDAAGNYVTDLAQDDFLILEDGVAQTILRFSTEQARLRVGIALDTSLSMSGKRLEKAQEAALGFLEALTPEDEGLVTLFADRVETAQEVTTDKRALARAISGARAEGGTALYDAIWRGARQLEQFDGRRVMILLSDGRDEAADGFGPGSLHTLEEATTQAVRSEVMVFAIGLGQRLDEQYVREWTRPSTGTSDRPMTQREVLATVAEASGGRLLLSPSANALRRAFSDIADDLRAQYALAYAPTNRARDGAYRRIEVRVERRDVQVVARRGYYAQRGEE